MNNKPVAYMDKKGFVITNEESAKEHGFAIPLYTQDQLEEARKLGMQQERALWNLSALTQEIMDTHPVKELNDGGEPVKNATYWKRQYNLMATQNDNLKSGLYHANEQIKYLESHPVEEQDESFDRTASHMAGEYVSWTSCVACGQRVTGDSIHTCSPQLKQLTDEEIIKVYEDMLGVASAKSSAIDFARAILRKAQEK